MPYRTLVVAPKTNLVLVEKEVNAVVNALNANMMTGVVTADQVLNELTRGWDIAWFMTHGTKDGILLSDGYLSVSNLTSFIRTSGSRLIVLNTCASIDAALMMHNELLTNFVCTLREVPDEDAYFMSKQFSFHLARGKSFSQAYLDAKPGQNQTYIFLVGKEPMTPTSALSSIPMPTPPPPQYASDRDYERFADQIRQLQEAMSGNKLLGGGIVAQIQAATVDLEELKRAVLILQIGGAVVVVIVFIILATVLSIYLR